MKARYSLAQLTCLNATPVELAEIAARTGYDSVSIRQIYMGLPNEQRYEMHKDRAMLAAFKKVLRDTGITVADVELARVLAHTDLASYEPVFALAAELGCRDILGSVWTEPSEAAVDTLVRMAEMAAQYELYLNMEYVPVSGIKDLQTMVTYIQAARCDNVKLMVDTHHFFRAGDTPEALRAVPASLFRMAHLCDVPAMPVESHEDMVRIMREERSYVGDGVVDIAAILNAMPMVTYSIELPNAAAVAAGGYEEHARRCLATCKAYVDAYVTGRL